MIYLVDDDNDDVEIMKEALFENSYKGPVLTENNGQALMDRLQRTASKPDVIILDLNMPLKDGFEALQEIRSTPHLNSIAVIILTASSRKEDEIRCLELGCNYFFKKPFIMKEYSNLVDVVKKFIRKAA
jgi:CheY-like chemotaxis protein